ncbi:SdrD B-like domain-containing protein [Micromonospora musae]|uniref:SdrD B-like domain-containing protein n=1 Tax=Micromonospora musae TaxID=1894970 RepID=UPI00343A06AE
MVNHVFRPTARRALQAGSLATAVVASMLTALPGSAVAAPNPADVVLGLQTDPGHVGADGGRVRLHVSVRNAGGAEADGVTVKLRLPTGVTLGWGGEGPAGWTCDAAAAKCKWGDLAAGAVAEFDAWATLPPGTDGQQAPISATADTESRESSSTNNTGTATIAYVVKPDLAFTFLESDGGKISTYGGNGARGSVSARAVNEGTVPAPGARFTFQMPADAFAGASTPSDPSWQCDFSTSTWVCENDQEIPPGEAAQFNLYPYFPAGTAGDTRTVTGSVSTPAPERSLANNSGTTTFTYAVPPPGDLNVYGLNVVGTHELRANQEFEVSAFVFTEGGSPAEDVAVRISLPPTVEFLSADAGDPAWACRLEETTDRFAECTRDHWDIATDGLHMEVKLRALPGTPAGPLTFTATASAGTPESSAENNTASDTATYIAEGAVTGRVWIDLDRDGQRDADEPLAFDKITGLTVVPETGSLPWDWPGIYTNTVSGTYWGGRLKPGRYNVKVILPDGSGTQFTTPDVGDDATDSDIVSRVGDYYSYGLSALVEVRDGAETAVDVGILPQS